MPFTKRHLRCKSGNDGVWFSVHRLAQQPAVPEFIEGQGPVVKPVEAH
ncbi:MAG: hypothetical protein ACI38O_06520 [Fibrobacter intestinalis]|nr:hypothetical protein [Fibrobacter intestinalis]